MQFGESDAESPGLAQSIGKTSRLKDRCRNVVRGDALCRCDGASPSEMHSFLLETHHSSRDQRNDQPGRCVAPLPDASSKSLMQVPAMLCGACSIDAIWEIFTRPLVKLHRSGVGNVLRNGKLWRFCLDLTQLDGPRGAGDGLQLSFRLLLQPRPS